MLSNIKQSYTDEQVAKMISDVDIEKDGMLSFEEFKAMILAS